MVLAATASAQEAPNAEEDPEIQARRIFALGEEAFEAERFEEAATYFERSFELTGRTDLLFNVGASHQRAGDVDAAIQAFERYLETLPKRWVSLAA